MAVGLLVNNHKVRKAIRLETVMLNTQVVQSVLVVYPILKAFSNTAVLYMMS